MERESVAGIAVREGPRPGSGDTEPFRIFTARRLPGGDLGGKWEFPGGKVRSGESYEDTVKREYLEELSVPVEAGPRIGFAKFNHGKTRFTLIALRVTLLSEDVSLNEHSEYRWVTPGELKNLDIADSDRLLFPAIFRYTDRLFKNLS
ncbi:MAG: NUDIX domain-containing protein [Treponema sp.]|nr:NUDIX domain-containing protein [Treponema sp.]